MLSQPTRQGTIVTIDAIGCRTGIALKIVEHCVDSRLVHKDRHYPTRIRRNTAAGVPDYRTSLSGSMPRRQASSP